MAAAALQVFAEGREIGNRKEGKGKEDAGAGNDIAQQPPGFAVDSMCMPTITIGARCVDVPQAPPVLVFHYNLLYYIPL